MRAGAGGGAGAEARRSGQERGSPMPPGEGQGRVSAGEGGGGRPARSPASSSRAGGGACPRRLHLPSSAPAPGALMRVRASERACLPSTSLGPVVLAVLGAVTPERFAHEPVRTEQLGGEEGRPGRAETLVGFAQAPQPISGPSRRLRSVPAPPGPAPLREATPNCCGPPPSRAVSAWSQCLVVGSRRGDAGVAAGWPGEPGAAKGVRGARERREVGELISSPGPDPTLHSRLPRYACSLGPPPLLRRRRGCPRGRVARVGEAGFM